MYRAQELLGGCSCLLIGDWGQLPPVMDLPLYTTVSRSELSDLGSSNYHLFDHAVVMEQVMRQAGQGADQRLFRDILMRLRNAEVTVDDWKHLRQQEDRRLLRMNDGSHRTPSSPTLPESKRRAKVPKDEPGPSQPSTPETEGQPDLPKVSRDHQEDRDG